MWHTLFLIKKISVGSRKLLWPIVLRYLACLVFSVTCVIVSRTLFSGVCYVTLSTSLALVSPRDTWRSTTLIDILA